MTRKRSLLIVEDDCRARNSLTKWFLSRNFSVTAVRHPRQALAAATLRAFDVALVDQSLPEQNGLQLISRLRAFLQGLRVVLLSSDPDGISSDEALRQGANAFLHKPCSLQQVDTVVQQVISSNDASTVTIPRISGVRTSQAGYEYGNTANSRNWQSPN